MLGLKITPEKCTGCVQCELACSFVKTGQFQPAHSFIRVHIFDELASYAPYSCFQCPESWCMTTCPTNAIAVHPQTGARVVIEGACVGCGLCTIACPFGTVHLEATPGKAGKCDLCAGEPACAVACPTGAIEFADDGGTVGAWLPGWSTKLQHEYADNLTGIQTLAPAGP